jgi:hypothetical protein
LGSFCTASPATSTTTPAVNPFVSQISGDIYSRVNALSQQPYTPYTGQLTAMFTPEQQAAMSNINSAYGWAQPYLDTASAYGQAGAAPITGAQIQPLMSPYNQSVVDATMANLSENFKSQTLPAIRGNAAAQGALGGDREAVAEAEALRQFQLGTAPTIAGLYNQSYNQAANLATQNANRLAQAGYFFGNLGPTAQSALLQGSQAQMGAGTLEQQTQQNLLNAQYQQYLQQLAFPYQQLGFLSSTMAPFLGAFPPSSTTTTTPSTPSYLQDILGLGTMGAGFFGGSKKAHGGRIGRQVGGGIPGPSGPSFGGPSLGATPFDFIKRGSGYVPGAPQVQLHFQDIRPPKTDTGGGPDASKPFGMSTDQLSTLGSGLSKGWDALYSKAGSVAGVPSPTAFLDAPEDAMASAGAWPMTADLGAGSALAEGAAGAEGLADMLPLLLLARRGGRIPSRHDDFIDTVHAMRHAISRQTGGSVPPSQRVEDGFNALTGLHRAGRWRTYPEGFMVPGRHPLEPHISPLSPAGVGIRALQVGGPVDDEYESEPPAEPMRRAYAPYLTRAAERSGLDADYLDKIMRIESGGNPYARTGSYHGLFQLSQPEFTRYGGTNIYDPYQNAEIGARKMAEERDRFRDKYGREPSPTEFYMLHQQGEAGTAAHLADPDAPAWRNMYGTGEGRQKGPGWARQAIWGNLSPADRARFGSVENVTSRDFLDAWNRKVEGSPYTAMAEAPPEDTPGETVVTGPTGGIPGAVARMGLTPEEPADAIIERIKSMSPEERTALDAEPYREPPGAPPGAPPGPGGPEGPTWPVPRPPVTDPNSPAGWLAGHLGTSTPDMRLGLISAGLSMIAGNPRGNASGLSGALSGAAQGLQTGIGTMQTARNMTQQIMQQEQQRRIQQQQADQNAYHAPIIDPLGKFAVSLPKDPRTNKPIYYPLDKYGRTDLTKPTPTPPVEKADSPIAPVGSVVERTPFNQMIGTANLEAEENPDIRGMYWGDPRKAAAGAQFAKDEKKKMSEQVIAAQSTLSRADDMQNSIDTISAFVKDVRARGYDKLAAILEPGIGGEERARLMNAYIMAQKASGGRLPALPDSFTAAVTTLGKENLFTAFAQIKGEGMSAREAQNIIQAARTSSPGLDTPESANRMLVSMLRQKSQMIMDQNSFITRFGGANGGYLDGWREQWEKKNSHTKYFANSLYEQLPAETRAELPLQIEALRERRDAMIKAEKGKDTEARDAARKEFSDGLKKFNRLYNNLGTYFMWGKVGGGGEY